MVKQNLIDIKCGVEDVGTRAARLRANGYDRVATAVEQIAKDPVELQKWTAAKGIPALGGHE
jgi:hypothetical protein